MSSVNPDNIKKVVTVDLSPQALRESTVFQLKSICTLLGIKGHNKKTKEYIIRMIEDHRNATNLIINDLEVSTTFDLDGAEGKITMVKISVSSGASSVSDILVGAGMTVRELLDHPVIRAAINIPEDVEIAIVDGREVGLDYKLKSDSHVDVTKPTGSNGSNG